MTGESIFNYISFACAVTGLVAVSTLNAISAIFIVLVTMILYLLYPPKLGFASLAPLLALCFTPRTDCISSGEAKLARHLPLLAALLFILIFWALSEPDTSGLVASHNLISICFLYLIFIQIIFLGRPRFILVATGIIFSVVSGNRAGLVLVLFLLPRFTFINLTKSAIGLAVLVLLIFVADLEQFRRPDAMEGQRLVMILEALYEIRENGLIGFFRAENFQFVGTFGEGLYDFHNSWLRLIYYEHFLGLFKILIFILSAYFIPLFWFMAIFFRASTDSFFLSNPIDIIFLMMLMKMVGPGFLKLRPPKADKSNVRLADSGMVLGAGGSVFGSAMLLSITLCGLVEREYFQRDVS